MNYGKRLSLDKMAGEIVNRLYDNLRALADQCPGEFRHRGTDIIWLKTSQALAGKVRKEL